VDVQQLIDLFGKKRGAYFHDASKGIDGSPVEERGEIESLSRISTLKKDTLDVDEIVKITDKQCTEVLEGLNQRGLDFRSIGIMVITSDLAAHSRSRTFEHPTRDLEVLKKTVRGLIEKYVEEANLPARRVGVKVFNFSKEGAPQSHLTDFLK
jgi:DNA polymerase-4